MPESGAATRAAPAEQREAVVAFGPQHRPPRAGAVKHALGANSSAAAPGRAPAGVIRLLFFAVPNTAPLDPGEVRGGTKTELNG
jgi:hypothetical protein